MEQRSPHKVDGQAVILLVGPTSSGLTEGKAANASVDGHQRQSEEGGREIEFESQSCSAEDGRGAGGNGDSILVRDSTSITHCDES